MKPEEWVERFAKELGLDQPDQAEVEAILALAAVAAHSSERTAAPVATWLAGKTGRPLSEIQAIADEIGQDG